MRTVLLSIGLSIAITPYLLAAEPARTETARSDGEPFAVATFHCLGLYWSPPGGSADKEVLVRYRPQGTAQDDPHLDRLNARIQERVVESGVAMISSTVLGGKFALRLCILNYRSSVEDVARALKAIVQVAQEEEAR